MRTFNEELERINFEIANVVSKAFTGKTVQERLAEITPQEYQASEEVWNELHRRRRELQKELDSINRQIEAVEKIINQPIKKA